MPKIPYKNKSPTGWWVFTEVEHWVSNRQKKLAPNSRCLTWVNTRLLRAKNRNEAYRKAVAFGRVGHPSKTRGGEWRFAGISMLLPIHDEIEDGAEIIWTVRGRLPFKRIKRLVMNRKQLPVFNDSDED